MGDYDLFRKIAKSNKTTQERIVEQMKYDISLDFCDSPSYKAVYINDSDNPSDAHVFIDKNDFNTGTINMKPDIILNSGDYISFEDNYWLCTEVNKARLEQEVGIVNKCTHSLSIIKNNVLLTIPCVVSKSSSSWGVEKTKFFPLPDGQIFVTVPNNSDTQSIKYNDVFEIGNVSKFKVIAINDVTSPNLLIFTMEQTNDEIETVYPTPSSDLVITGEDTIMEDSTSTYTSNIECTWELTNDDESDNEYIVILSQTNTSIILKAGTTLGEYITLTATSIEDDSIIGEKTIQVRGLF